MKLNLLAALLLFGFVVRGESQSGPPIIVKAQVGDTVTRLALRYGADPVEVAKYNGLLPNSVLGGGREVKVPGGRVPTCKVTRDALPDIRGMKLRMTTSEFRSLLRRASADSVPTFSFPSEFRDAERMTGVRIIATEFFDDRMSVLTLTYDDSVRWDSDAEFTRAIAENLKVPFAAWTRGDRGYSVHCIDFSVQTGSNQVTLVDQIAAQARIDEQLQENERKKKAFKP